MKRPLLQILLLTGGLGLIATLAGCCSTVKSCFHQVLILHQPQSQTVLTNANATFSVYALAGPPFTTSGVSYQWQFNGTLLDGNNNWVNIPGETGSSIVIKGVQISNTGFYRVMVSGSDTVASDPASLHVMTVDAGGTTHGGGPITVYGTPVAKADTISGCPGGYAGYVYFANTTSWGWAPINPNNLGLAVDPQGNLFTTDVQAYGYWGDVYCGTGGSVSVPPTIFSPQYQFFIYFLNTPLPAGSYKITLTNFR